ncbi:MAG: hypothetical protein ACPGFC_04430, partial [Paracoccaceae bacterium]
MMKVTMGDQDGPSKAAQGARPNGQHTGEDHTSGPHAGQTEGAQTQAAAAKGGDPQKAGWLRRLFSRRRRAAPPKPVTQATPSVPVLQGPTLQGLLNLRQMRVRDVAIPKVEIIAVPDTLTRSELVQKFAESALTRIPVYAGTLDTPVGMVHLKDFALSHG